jgi:integrase
MVRGFAAYLRTIDPGNEVLPWGLLPSGKPRTSRASSRVRREGEQGDSAPLDVSVLGGGLRAALDHYLRIRRALGYKLTKDGRALRRFVEFLEARGAERVTIELALDWATMPENGTPACFANRLSMVRGFAAYLRTIDPTNEIPPARLLRAGTRRSTPYVYSDHEIAALIDAAGMLRYPLLVATYRTLIGLLAVSGLRVGEAIRLDQQDIDWERGLLVVRETKFGKTRLVPLHLSAIEALDDYLRRRDQLYPCPVPSTSAVFISAAGTRLIYNCVNFTFLKLTRRVGLRPRSPTCRARIHDIRHTFAVRTVLDGYRADGDVQRRLSVLSTYLGHVNPSNTYWYLSAAPELLGLAGERLQRHLDQLGDSA